MASSFLSFSINEIITIDNQNGIPIHCYGVVDWMHVHVLLTNSFDINDSPTLSLISCERNM